MSFYSVDSIYEEIVVINKSKFITTLIPIESQEDAQKNIEIINKKYSDATHNCYAYTSNEIATEQRFSDDGEPQGTAGIPMLEVLKKRKMYMTLAVVTRYFGGIKLGAGGLVQAYSSCVANALNNASIVENVMSHLVEIKTNYSQYKKLEEIIKNQNGEIINIIFDEDVIISAIIPLDDYKKAEENIIDFSLGQAKIEIKNTKYNKFRRGEK